MAWRYSMYASYSALRHLYCKRWLSFTPKRSGDKTTSEDLHSTLPLAAPSKNVERLISEYIDREKDLYCLCYQLDNR